jgi:pimeloyl-ACP methyl ester carboxylesterase
VEVVRANGLEIAYERVGDGPPLVLVHGAAVDCRMWRPQLTALADEFTVVAWDEPGAGRSSDVAADFALADYGACRRSVLGRDRRAGALPSPPRACRDADPG